MDRRIALVVEDDPDVSVAIGRSLAQAGFEVTVAATGAEALGALERIEPDLVTLDLSLPDIDGLEVCRRIRANHDCYVIMISARREEVDRLTGLEAGADDFLNKPFSVRELQARVAALFRRPRTRLAAPVTAVPRSARSSRPTSGAVDGAASGATSGATPGATTGPRAAIPAQRGRPVLDCGSGLAVDPEAREVTIDGNTVDLTRTEFDLLAHLASRPGVVVRRDEVLRNVWSTDFVPDDTHNVDVHLANLRRKLRRHSSATWIRTVRGVGLRLDRE